MEIIDDMHRAVRFVRHHAVDYGMDAQRLGVAGGSAGGHLSLMLATRGGPGPVRGRRIPSTVTAAPCRPWLSSFPSPTC